MFFEVDGGVVVVDDGVVVFLALGRLRFVDDDGGAASGFRRRRPFMNVFHLAHPADAFPFVMLLLLSEV